MRARASPNDKRALLFVTMVASLYGAEASRLHCASSRWPVGFTAEVSGLSQHGASAQTQALAALNYNVSRKLVFDVAVAAGLSHAAPNWQLMGGVTMQLGHWF